MEGERVSPLWPMMRNVLPHDQPNPVTKPALWSFERIRPLLLRAGELTPVEKAERRVLVLNDPGRGKGAMQVTSSIYVGLQLLLPGEKAPAHKHTPSAARIVVEGEGAFTIVDGEKCAMERGDLILTPGGMWHDHGHDGTEPVIWLDALDLPLFVFLEGSYAEEGELPGAAQPAGRLAGRVQPARPRAGRGNGGERRAIRCCASRGGTPKTALRATRRARRPRRAGRARLRQPRDRRLLPADHGLYGDDAAPGRDRAPAAALVERGVPRRRGRRAARPSTARASRGSAATPSRRRSSRRSSTVADGEAFLIRIHDAPLQQKLGFYEERARAERMRFYGYFRSSAAYRCRIAFNLKGVAPEFVPDPSAPGRPAREEYLRLNPQGLVPALDIGWRVLTQSLAIIEWLDETHPEPALLPRRCRRARRDPRLRARDRGRHPPAQQPAGPEIPEGRRSGTTRRRSTLGTAIGSRTALPPARRSSTKGGRRGPYCFGAEPTLADICLVPQIANARRVNSDLSACPTLLEIEAHCAKHAAFADAAPEKQPDAE